MLGVLFIGFLARQPFSAFAIIYQPGQTLDQAVMLKAQNNAELNYVSSTPTLEAELNQELLEPSNK